MMDSRQILVLKLESGGDSVVTRPIKILSAFGTTVGAMGPRNKSEDDGRRGAQPVDTNPGYYSCIPPRGPAARYSSAVFCRDFIAMPQ